jgi:hypothetical protein
LCRHRPGSGDDGKFLRYFIELRFTAGNPAPDRAARIHPAFMAGAALQVRHGT